MPDRILPIEVHLRFFALREVLAEYVRLSTVSPNAPRDVQAALTRVEDIRNKVQLLVPETG